MIHGSQQDFQDEYLLRMPSHGGGGGDRHGFSEVPCTYVLSSMIWFDG